MEIMFCHQFKHFSLSENVFEIYFSICTSEKFFKNPENDTTGVLQIAVLKTVIKTIKKYLWRSLFFTKRTLQRMLPAFFCFNLGFWNEAVNFESSCFDNTSF